MLILQLRVNESILLPGDVEIMLTSIGIRGLRLRGGHVKLGIRAPRHMRIHRKSIPKRRRKS